MLLFTAHVCTYTQDPKSGHICMVVCIMQGIKPHKWLWYNNFDTHLWINQFSILYEVSPFPYSKAIDLTHKKAISGWICNRGAQTHKFQTNYINDPQ